MTTYLNKEKVLEAIKNLSSAHEILIMIERGEFDVKLLSTCAERQRKHGEVLAAKDAEITRLKTENGDLDCRLEGISETMHETIVGLEKENHSRLGEILTLRGRIANYQKGEENLILENQKMGDRITELEKLCDIQKETIDQHHKKFNALQKEQSQMRDPERKVVCEILANGFTMHEKPKKNEPELFICPKVNCMRGFCYHRVPHRYMHECGSTESPSECPNCVQFMPDSQSNPDASDIGKASKIATVEQNHCDQCDHWDMCEGCPFTDERRKSSNGPVKR